MIPHPSWSHPPFIPPSLCSEMLLPHHPPHIPAPPSALPPCTSSYTSSYRPTQDASPGGWFTCTASSQGVTNMVYGTFVTPLAAAAAKKEDRIVLWAAVVSQNILKESNHTVSWNTIYCYLNRMYRMKKGWILMCPLVAFIPLLVVAKCHTGQNSK